MVFGIEVVLGGGVPEFVLERRAQIEPRDQFAEIPVIGEAYRRREKELVYEDCGSNSQDTLVDAVHDVAQKSFFKIYPIDLGGEHEVALGESLDLVGIGDGFDAAPGEAQIGMVSFRF